MTSASLPDISSGINSPLEDGDTSRIFQTLSRFPIVRELLIILAFCLFTAALTWPYVTRLRDVVVDRGDPYLMAWILWWDYHQTFTDPFHLFNANIFYPLKYTLAFSENSYGISLLFFPLYAAGLTPLTVQAVALFFGFVLTGYGAFRLGRTLTGSSAVGWVAGIIFAFVPYRFHTMSQVVYVYAPWLPLMFEALILFVRERSRTHAAWLGCTFLLSGLTTISWFVFSLVPFALFAAILLTRYNLWRNRDFWQRSAVALTAASLLLLPFFLPYIAVSRLYGFKRTIDEIKANSAWPIHWLSVENRNRLWRQMGEPIPEGWKFKLFPGLLPILFSLAAFSSRGDVTRNLNEKLNGTDAQDSRRRWIPRLDTLIIVAFTLAIPAIGFDRSDAFGGLFGYLTSEIVLGVLTGALIARLCLAYPPFLGARNSNLLETLRSPGRCDAFWLGVLLTVIGFCFSLGWNFFVYRLCYDLIPMFKSMRVAARGAMIAYLGLALLSGLGVRHIAQVLPVKFPWLRSSAVYALACTLLLFELNAAPMQIARGEAYPDEITRKLKQTPMRGGIVELPAGGDFNYRYMLRAADHQKPLIVGTSGFNSPIEDKIETLTYSGTIGEELLDLFETVPASYLVIENQSIPPERKTDYETFLSGAVSSGRLRFINRYDAGNDLYAVVKIEPEARSESTLPAGLSSRDWAGRLEEDPVNLLSQLKWSQKLYRAYVASTGELPRYREFLSDMEMISRGLMPGSKEQDRQFAGNFRGFLENWIRRPTLARSLGSLNDDEYIDRLLKNAGLNLNPSERDELVRALSTYQETRAGVLLKVVEDPRFVEKENNRSIVVFHYFGYLRRNPDEPPDHNLDGLKFWVQEMERGRGPGKVTAAFAESFEYQKLKTR